MTAPLPPHALLEALDELDRRKRSQALPDEALCLELAERGLAVWNGRFFGSPPVQARVYVVTREGDEVLARWRNGK